MNAQRAQRAQIKMYAAVLIIMAAGNSGSSRGRFSFRQTLQPQQTITLVHASANTPNDKPPTTTVVGVNDLPKKNQLASQRAVIMWLTDDKTFHGPNFNAVRFCKGYSPETVHLLLSVSTEYLTVKKIASLCGDPEGYSAYYPIKFSHVDDPSGERDGYFYGGLRAKTPRAQRWTPDPDKRACPREQCCLDVLQPLHRLTLPSDSYVRMAPGTEVNDWVYEKILTDDIVKKNTIEPGVFAGFSGYNSGFGSFFSSSEDPANAKVRVGVCARILETINGRTHVEVLESFLLDEDKDIATGMRRIYPSDQVSGWPDDKLSQIYFGLWRKRQLDEMAAENGQQQS